MDLFAELLHAPQDNVHETYAKLRESDGGVHVDDERNMVLVTRHADVEKVYRSRDSFSNDTFWESPAAIHDSSDDRQVRYVEHFKNFLLFLDAPKHTRLRNLVRHAFTPDAINVMSDVLVTAADEILDEFDAGQEVDFVGEIAEKLPVQVIATMIGIPPEDHVHFRRWTQALIDSLMFTVQGEDRVQALHTGSEMIDYLDGHIRRRRAATGTQPNDLLTLLQNAQDVDDSLTSEELVCMVMVLLGAGNATTTDLLGNAMVLLSENPEQRAELTAHPELMEQALEEILRLEPSLRVLIRKTVGEVELGDRTIGPGRLVFLCNAAANRDPRKFPEPDRFDIRRVNSRHLAFGSGSHYCLGAPLARLEGRVMLTRFLGRFPEATVLLDGPPRYKLDFTSRSLRELPMVLA
ncbi:cytochrome P450 [Pseudonocardia spinosispora]|uniref:cytochrome P450 n=1 Tax=Pseudonocardia spinosispora TaxID=103441 RepID=UPI0003FC9CAC|nr:cytochrome P450 [Pseudonocardia spinosispora]